MADTKGRGCCLAAFVAFIYQMFITLLAGYIANVVNASVINQMSEIGSLLIIGIAFNLLRVTELKIGNFILSPFIPVFLYIGKKFFILLL